MRSSLMRLSAAFVAVMCVETAGPPLSWATPSTTFWAPSTPYVQGFGVFHVTYDSDFFIFPKGLYDNIPRFAIGRR